MAGKNEIKEEYTSSLADLTFNSKPLISVLTILAEENIAHAKEIVQAIEAHLSRVCARVKLPVLYLIDCIIKNVGESYTALFCQNIVSTFCSVFEQVDEKTRAEMYKLRQTWNDVIPPKKLYALDVQIKQLDPAWPVTALPPSSIHFNPKFLVTNATAPTSSSAPTVSKATGQLRSSTIASSLDPKTITMHQKLINKQRELLELQQRKLELELLQTQVKLHEQIKSQNPTQSTTPATQSQTISTSAGNGRSHNSSTTRIAPVGGNLANARPVRDPRLIRHQQQQQQTQPNLSTTVNSVLVENKFKAGTQVTIDSENKIVNNKTNVRNERIEHGLVNNKGNIESHGKSKTLPHSSSPLKHTQKIGSSRKSSKSVRDSKLSINLSSSSDLPTKKSDTKSRLTKLSNLKFKKKSSNSNSVRSDKDGLLSRSKESTSHSDKSNNSGRYDKSDSLIHGVEKKSDKHSKSLKSVKDNKIHKSDNSTLFKDLKGSTKNRNYIRRSQTSVSPELSQDVDLRLGGPPEKQARLQGDITDDKNHDNPNQPMDVDLRQLPAAVGKKRPSIENNDSSAAKKSKTEIFDVLFGREDTDLRQLSGVLSSPQSTERPPTPPPPIISDKISKTRETSAEEKTPVEKPEISNFDVLRAKLANAVNQDKFTSQESPEENKLKSPSDMDMRRLSTFGDRVGSALKKIIISQADEEIIKTGNMTKAQGKALMTKIVAQIETQKLREAQRKESESISLQPISDDELEPDFSSDSDGDGTVKDKTRKDKPKKSRLQRINLINDDRQAVIPPQVSQLEDSYPKFANNRNMDYRDPRRGRNWRGTGRNRPKVWENSPALPPPLLRPGIHAPLRPQIEPWARPPTNSAWRSMAPSIPDAMLDETLPPLIPSHVTDQGSQSPNSNIQDIPALEYVHPDSYKFITIDGEAREIRYYDETAIVFMSANDPREITFHSGTRRIYFDDEFFTLKLNHPYEEISIKGNIHKVRLGGPSREIFVDGKGYECYFGQIEKTIDLDGNKIVVKLEPPPPQVKIGQDKRTDLVAGKIQLVVNAKNMFTVFLDAKPQTFEIDGQVFTLKFVDALRAVLINDVRYEFEYGGLPKPIMVENTKHFMRFSVLPRGIKPGHVRIKDMDSFKPISSPNNDNENSQDGVMVGHLNPLLEHSSAGVRNSPERNSNSPSQFQNFLHNQNINNLDLLSSVMASSMFHSSSEGGYKVENGTGTDSQPSEVQPSTMVNVPTVPPQETVTAPTFNISDLFQKLVATGIVTSATRQKPEEPPSAPPPLMKTHFKNFKPVSFDKPETLKTRHSPRILSLYVGMQCSSCGMRFPPEHTMHYSQHLDWHFRQNRKGKKNIRKAASRKWYYILADWKNYEEIEDLEEREKSYFENQNQNQAENANEEAEEDVEIPCVSADPEVQIATCEVCQDRFEQFYNEEKDEWQLRKAIRVDDKIYHPLCYEDYQNSLINESKLSSGEIENESNSTGGIPGLENVLEESVVENKNEEDDVMEIIDNIDDEDDGVTVELKPFIEDAPKSEVVEDEDEDDDDVIINEVVPEKIVVDDDDKDDYVPTEEGLIPGVVVKIEPIDDGFVDVEDGVVKVLKENEIKIKDELLDGDMETEPLEVGKLPESTDRTQIEVVSSIDGNVAFEGGVQPPSSANLSAKIKINITKPLPAVINKDNHDTLNEDLKVDFIDPSQPLPPGEEPVQLNVKPALKGLELRRQPMVKKGSELTGLCSIM